MKEGYYLSFGASVLFEKARKPKEVVREIPLANLLIETDAPYQSPVKDHRHEPGDVLKIYEAISRIKDIETNELCKKIEANFDRLFSCR